MTLICAVRDDMLAHMLKEEQILFPYVTQMEEAAEGHRVAPTPFFGTVKKPCPEDDGGARSRRGASGDPAQRGRRVHTPGERLFQLSRALSASVGIRAAHARAHPRRKQPLLPRAIAPDRAGQPAAFADACGSSCAH
jgi:hypothetical protein